MLALNFVLLGFLATSSCHPGYPRYVLGQWTLSDDNPQYGDIEEQTLEVEELVQPESLPVIEGVMAEDQELLPTLEPTVLKEQDSDEKLNESVVWKMVLVAAVLLVSVVGSLSVAYYMCVWRGGRIHYQPQKGGYA